MPSVPYEVMDEVEDLQAGPNIEADINTPAEGVQQLPKRRRDSISPGSPEGRLGKKAKYTFKVSILTMLHPDWKVVLDICALCDGLSASYQPGTASAEGYISDTQGEILSNDFAEGPAV